MSEGAASVRNDALASPLADADGPRTIAEVRADQEAAKDHWSAIVREGIIEALRQRGDFHADYLAPLGIPDEHRNIIGSQVAKLVNQGWMIECGRRKSEIPSRNGAKSNLYRLTRAGVAGVGAGKPQPREATGGQLESGSTSISDLLARGDSPKSPAETQPSVGGSPEPQQLFEVEGERPLSAWTDAEAA